mmetsp:Transcript_38641/g.95579  ORF Transcript_38641/g.95579 Transcript_38641/m.95579 type:complete len:285 (+) Transcript_38641:221-1075(+)
MQPHDPGDERSGVVVQLEEVAVPQHVEPRLAANWLRAQRDARSHDCRLDRGARLEHRLPPERARAAGRPGVRQTRALGRLGALRPREDVALVVEAAEGGATLPPICVRVPARGRAHVRVGAGAVGARASVRLVCLCERLFEHVTLVREREPAEGAQGGLGEGGEGGRGEQPVQRLEAHEAFLWPAEEHGQHVHVRAVRCSAAARSECRVHHRASSRFRLPSSTRDARRLARGGRARRQWAGRQRRGRTAVRRAARARRGLCTQPAFVGPAADRHLLGLPERGRS